MSKVKDWAYDNAHEQIMKTYLETLVLELQFWFPLDLGLDGKLQLMLPYKVLKVIRVKRV